jgi:signal transduction histidine kinase
MANSLYRQARFFKLWQTDPPAALNEFIREIQLKGLFEPEIFQAEKGQIILREGEKTKYLFVLIDGSVSLFKSEAGGGPSIPVTQIDPGGMFGVMSFFSNNQALTSAVADVSSKVFRLNRKQVEMILTGDYTLGIMGRQMLTANLMERYAQVVELNVQLKTANNELDVERSRLSETLRELKAVHKRLIHQEKMATLGQLIAGVAHEINNPTAALENAVQYLSALLPDLFRLNIDGRQPLRTDFFHAGLDSTRIKTGSQRDYERELQMEFPDLKSSECRQLAVLETERLQKARLLYAGSEIKELRICLDYMEAGMHLRRIRLTSARIAGLVKSLKRYSRHESTKIEPVDLREGILDTLQILGNRLKDIEMEVVLDPNLPKVVLDAAEMNQVWTNILVNACEALDNQGRVYIRSEIGTNGISIRIGDDGPGVPENLREKIFKPSFTTRNSSGNFGLGLGLSISRDLVIKNGGKILVADSAYGGAEFCVYLPFNTSL